MAGLAGKGPEAPNGITWVSAPPPPPTAPLLVEVAGPRKPRSWRKTGAVLACIAVLLLWAGWAALHPTYRHTSFVRVHNGTVRACPEVGDVVC